MQNEKDDDGPFPEIEEFEQEPFFIPDIYFLEQSNSAEEFHERLSKIICDTPKYNQAELNYLADVVSKPWKAKKGRKPHEGRDLEILHLSFLYFDQTKPKKVQDFIKFIAKKYGMEFDAARKAITKAMGPRRKKGEIIDDDLFPEKKDDT